VTIDLKGTRVSGLSALGKRKGRLKGWKVDILNPEYISGKKKRKEERLKVEISEPRIPKGIVTVDSRRPCVDRS
jgi:hypothetical protein